MHEIADPSDGAPAVIIYTSGTTGTPKGATLTHANLAAGAETGRDLVDAGPHSVTVATLPLFHVFGMSAIMNVTIRAHGLLTLVPRFDPAKVLEVIERDRATTFGGVPTMYAALLHHPERERHEVQSLDLCVSGGAPMPVEVMRGPFVMSGYWNRPEATEEVMRDGFLHTGDIATVDEDGYYFIVDRKKDLIIRGGYNIYPREIEIPEKVGAS